MYLSSEVIAKLLKHGASVAIRNNSGEMPLHIALKNGKKLDMIQKILQYGADINAESNNGHTPLYIALSNDSVDVEVIKELLKYGAYLHGSSKLFSIFKGKKCELLKYSLLEHPDSIQCIFCMKLKLKSNGNIKQYETEINKMKIEYITNELTLYDYIVKKCDYGKLFSNKDDILSKSSKFSQLLSSKYP